jgi:small subunit ribosomal protein S5
VPHEQQARIAGAHILLKPAAPGTGLIAGGVVRVILEVAGISNILSKSIGSSNKINIAYATIEALKAIKPKEEWHRQPKSVDTTKKKKIAPKSVKTVEAK